MDSYLSGREKLGESNKAKRTAELPASPIGQLAPAEKPDSEVKEECGEGGSKVSYVMEEGRVAKIVVTCACGQVTEIDCRYDD